MFSLLRFLLCSHVGAARRKVFNAEYFQKDSVKALLEDHKKATGEAQLPRGGYPDCGSGRFSNLLSYDGWLVFNNVSAEFGGKKLSFAASPRIAGNAVALACTIHQRSKEDPSCCIVVTRFVGTCFFVCIPTAGRGCRLSARTSTTWRAPPPS